MAVFADLTSYEYSDEPAGEPEMKGALVNIGWLGLYSKFDVADPVPDLVKVLTWLAVQEPVQQSRGFHQCEFCRALSVELARQDIVVESQDFPGKKHFLGSAEIRVRGKGNVTYAAPDLVVHYVEKHGYRPPQEFVDAALSYMPLPS